MALRLVKSAHDAERWGAAYTNEQAPRKLLRIADIIRRRTDDVTPRRVAAREVVQVLRASDCSEFFLLVKNDRARALGAADLWCAPYLGYPRHLLAEGSQGDLPLWHVIPASSPWSQFDAEPAFQGKAGMLSCLETSWASETTEVGDLDSDLAATVAMLEVEANALFAFHAEPNPVSAACPMLVATTEATDWSSAELDQMRSMRVTMSDADIAKKYGISRQRVGQLLGSRQAVKAAENASRRQLA